MTAIVRTPLTSVADSGRVQPLARCPPAKKAALRD